MRGKGGEATGKEPLRAKGSDYVEISPRGGAPSGGEGGGDEARLGRTVFLTKDQGEGWERGNREKTEVEKVGGNSDHRGIFQHEGP